MAGSTFCGSSVNITSVVIIKPAIKAIPRSGARCCRSADPTYAALTPAISLGNDLRGVKLILHAVSHDSVSFTGKTPWKAR